MPIKVSATAGNAVDWTIYGNDDNGTENEFDPNNKFDNYYYDVNGQRVYTASPPWNCTDQPIPVLPNTEYTFSPNSSSGSLERHIYLDSSKNFISAIPSGAQTFTTPSNCAYMLFSWRAVSYDIMLVKGSTVPDHYIPYQKGVGERTENVIPSAVNGTYTSGRGTVTCNNGNYHFHVSEGERSISIFVPIPEFTLPVSVEKGGNGRICFFNSKAISTAVVGCLYNNTQVSGAYSMTPVNRVVTNYGTSSTAQCNTLQFYAASSVTELDIDIAPCIVTGDTPTSFIPYGYQIPLTISQQGATTKTADIYIGSSPLTQGQTITKSQSNVDLELFSGDNIIDTTLYNKPNTSITYNSSVLGVGERAEITGELPIDFRSNGDDLLGYKIYGTAEGSGAETGNLAESVEQGTWSVTGFVKSNATTHCRIGNIIDVVSNQQYTLYLKCPSHNGNLNIQFKNDSGTSKGETGWQYVGGSGSYTATIPSDATKITIILSIDSGSGNCTPANFTNVMLVKGSTPPSTYVPYGYKLPLTITSGTESKDTDIFIGDSKLGEEEYIDYGEQKIYRRILFMTHNDKQFITKDNKDFCLRRRGYSG